MGAGAEAEICIGSGRVGNGTRLCIKEVVSGVLHKITA